MARCVGILLLSLFFNSALYAEISVSEAQPLAPINQKTDVVVDALWLHNQNKLLVSKQGSPPEIITFAINLNEQTLNLEKRQRFLGFAPILFETRDFVFAFKFLSPLAHEKSTLYTLDDTGEFLPTHVFDQEVKNIAATRKSNFLATIDYQKAEDLNQITPRLKLFNTQILPKESLISLRRQGNAIGFTDITSVSQPLRAQSSVPTNVVTAVAMSPLGRIKHESKDIPANRILAVAHTAKGKTTLHLWYFPNIDRDFNNGQGHITVPFGNPIDTIAFSPHTFGKLLVTNKRLGKIWVMEFDFTNKSLTKVDALDIEKAQPNQATHMATVFGPHDEIVAGINQSIILFTRRDQGSYKQTSIQPADFSDQESFSKILIKGSSIITVGTRGNVQFGEIK